MCKPPAEHLVYPEAIDKVYIYQRRLSLYLHWKEDPWIMGFFKSPSLLHLQSLSTILPRLFGRRFSANELAENLTTLGPRKYKSFYILMPTSSRRSCHSGLRACNIMRYNDSKLNCTVLLTTDERCSRVIDGFLARCKAIGGATYTWVANSFFTF